jgi:hypothetical protein
MFRLKGVAKTVLVAIISMPLLTELVVCEDDFCFRHGAPSGAFLTLRHGIPPKTVMDLESLFIPLWLEY